MKIQKSKVQFIVALIALIWMCSPSIWFASKFSGSIIDENNRPVSNAVVLVGWSFYDSTLAGGLKPLVLKEARMDENGHFSIEGWGPMLGPNYYSKLSYSDPRIDVVHAEYLPSSVNVDKHLFPRRKARFLNGTPKSTILIKLTKIDHKDLRNTSKFIEKYNSDLYMHYQTTDAPRCLWDATPNFLAEVKSLENKYAIPNKDFSLTVFTCRQKI